MWRSHLRLAAAGAYVLCASFLFLPVAIVLLPWRVARIKLCNVFGKLVGSVATGPIAGNDVVVLHRERLARSFPAVYVSNHASTLDPFLAMWICPMGGCGVAKREVVRIPLFGWLYRLSGHLVIDRGDPEQAVATLRQAAAWLRDRRLGVWIWPEGTRSPDGRLRRFKKGFAHLALETRLPVVPVVIRDTHRALPARSWRLYPTRIEIEVLEPIDTWGWSRESLDLHVEETWRAVAAALGPDQRPAGLDGDPAGALAVAGSTAAGSGFPAREG